MERPAFRALSEPNTEVFGLLVALTTATASLTGREEPVNDDEFLSIPVGFAGKLSADFTKFKLHFYQEIFRRFQDREASLTTVETFCMESIMALGRPTVNEFATFMCISPPNAAYKVNSLVKKGYIRKIQSPSDRREFHLEVTQKYIDYYNISSNYMSEVMDRIMARFSPEDCGKLEEILTVVSRELMPEVPLPERTEE